jgi:hypothetical protein
MEQQEEYITIVHNYSYHEYWNEACQQHAIPVDNDLFEQYRADLIRNLKQEYAARNRREQLEARLHLQ